MKKRLLFFGLIFVMACMLSACGGDNSSSGDGAPDEHTHSFGEWSITKEATCVAEGEETRACSCGESETRPISATGTHIYGNWTETSAPTCVNAGEEMRSCSCGDFETRPVSATGIHIYGDWTETSAPTCVNEGEEKRSCACGDFETRPVSATGIHIYGNWTETSAPTCVNEGEEMRSCSCGDFETRPVSATGVHIYGNWIESAPATCRQEGEEKRSCTCGDFETRPIPLAQHKLDTENECENCTFALEYTEGLEYEYIESKDAYRLVGMGTSTTDRIVIPQYHEGKPVISIKSYAFYPSSSNNYAYGAITSITIPASMEEIGESAFDCCYKLFEVYNFSSLNIAKGDWRNGYVGYYARDIYTTYSAQSKLSSVDGFTMYDDGTERILLGYTGTESDITLPDSSEEEYYSVYEYAFYKRLDITGVTIPSSVLSMGQMAFYGCASIEYVTFSDNSNIEIIPSQCFADCVSLASLSFGENGRFNEIERAAFDKTSITEIMIPKGINKIGNSAFRDCNLLTKVEFENESVLESIGEYAFDSCDLLESIEIPSTVKFIDAYAFNMCYKMNEVYIYDLAKWCEIEFKTDRSNPLANAGYNMGKLYLGGIELTEINIPQGVTAIGDYAFVSYDFVTSVVLPSGVTHIGISAFDSCKSLSNVTLSASLESIGDKAFFGCSILSSVTIPASVTEIGVNAFSPSNITSVVFEIQNGWSVVKPNNEADKIILDAADLKNEKTAAQYLKNTYCDYRWNRA